MKARHFLAALGIAAGLVPVSGFAQQGDGTEISIPTNIFKPSKVQPTDERIAAFGSPPGFKVEAVAAGLKNARIVGGLNRQST